MHGRRSPGRSGGRGAPALAPRCTLKNWLPWDGSTGRGARSHGRSGAGIGALYTGRGPVCGMIIRGGAAMGSAGFVGAAACICVTFEGGWVAGGALPTGVAGGMRGGTAIAAAQHWRMLA